LYLEHTLVVTGGVTPTPMFVHEIESRNAPFPVVLENFAEKKKISIPASEWDVDLWQPELGMFSFRRTCVELRRLPLRQNKKGICPATVQLRNLFTPMLHTINGMAPSGYRLPGNIRSAYLTDEGCRGIFHTLTTERRFFPLGEAVHRILQQKVFARALSKEFACTVGITPDYPVCLWRGDVLVGGINENLSICVKNHSFFPEVFDQFGSETEVTAT